MVSESNQIEDLDVQSPAANLRLEFGIDSHLYSKIMGEINSLWNKVKDNNNAKLKFNSWRDAFEIVYGYSPEQSMFVSHTYLAMLVKLAIYFKLEISALIDKERIAEVINGGYFLSFGILNFVENDFSTWILHDEIAEESLGVVCELAEELARYDFSQIDEDFFKEIYEEMIGRDKRHRTGEYYTPEWLTQLILSEVMKLWEENHKLPRILDPACGSGTFLCNAIYLFKEKLSKDNLLSDRSLNTILDNVVGIDINPLASMLTKANYIIALGDLVKRGVLVRIPIFTANALKLPADELGQFDILIGNPPWIVMRSIKNARYQEYLKKEVLKYKLVDKNVHLFTQMEMAALFFCKCSDIYLRNNGIIGFVMPRSVISGTIQHINFRHFQIPRLKLVKIIDLEDVHPLFNMPSCVLIAIKSEQTQYPILTERYRGDISKRNGKLSEVQHSISTENYMYSPPRFPSRPSAYFDKFKTGAAIFPRTFYFIDIISRDDNKFIVQTSDEIFRIVKTPWEVKLDGKIEPNFIYATLLAWEIIPFGYVRLRPIILPIEPSFDGYKLMTYDELHKAGFTGTADWFKRAHKIWEEKRTEKSEKRFPRLIDRLNYSGLLTSQNPSKRFIVLYNATGTNVVSCVVDRLSLPNFRLDECEITPKGFVTDVKSWSYETSDETEAYCLSTFLNSEVINKLIKPLQPRGLFGPRAIHRRPLLFQIPRFDKNEERHIELAKIGKKLHETTRQILPRKNNNLRKYVRRYFEKENARINALVQSIL